MQQMRVDKKIGDALADLRSQTVILDEQGKVLGFFSPMAGRRSPGPIAILPRC